MIQIEYRPLSELVPDERNPKSHVDAEIQASFDRFGFAESIVVDDRTGKLVAGHGRLETMITAKEAGEKPPANVTRRRDGEWLVPVQTGWSSKDDEEAAAFIVAANRLTETGGWDDSSLISILDNLAASERGLTGVGYDDSARDDIRARLEELQAREAESGEAIRQAFAEKQVRSMILEYAVDDFTYLTETAAMTRTKLNVQSNAELFMLLLEKTVQSA